MSTRLSQTSLQVCGQISRRVLRSGISVESLSCRAASPLQNRSIFQHKSKMSTLSLNETVPAEPSHVAYQVTPLGPVLAAEIVGLDLTQPMSDSLFNELDDIIGEHLVVCFRGQHALSPENQIKFTEAWGPAEPHPLGSRVDSHPAGIPRNVMVVQNTMKKNKIGTVRNDIWHTDLSCMERPVGLSVLHAKEVPPPGWGDTMFANMQAAWQTLPPMLRQKVAWMNAVHDTSHFEGANRKENFTKSASNVHPVVRTHPKTGRHALYISGNFISQFEGLTKDDSAHLLQQLIDHATAPENVYRHRWHPGDLVVWDNRATMHYAVFDYLPGQPRTMHRTTAAGERPFRRLAEAGAT